MKEVLSKINLIDDTVNNGCVFMDEVKELNLFDESNSDEDSDELETDNYSSFFYSESDDFDEGSYMDVEYFYENTENNAVNWIFTFSDNESDSDYNEHNWV